MCVDNHAEMVDDSFILYLFQRIEELSDDASDPYHSAIIRVLVGNLAVAVVSIRLTRTSWC